MRDSKNWHGLMTQKQWLVFLISILCTFCNLSTAQTVIGGLTPDTSAQLDIQSTTRGLLLPRMTESQRDSIIQPAQGLQIFNLTSSCLEINMGTPQSPLWADVKCLGSISTLECNDANLSRPLVVGTPILNTTLSIPYTGGNGGVYGTQAIPSTGIAGLIATLPEGSFAKGDGSLKLILSGTPSTAGTASFGFSIAGKFCLLQVSVDAYAAGADTCGAYIAPGVWQSFLCHNLASANTFANPQEPTWEINGGYWQWGRKGPSQSQWLNSNTTQFAHGPTGPGTSQTNESAVSGWSTTDAPTGAWDDGSKTINDPCPDGFRVPPQTVWAGVIANNATTVVGSWTADPANYGSGVRFGSNLMLPASGYRYLSGGWLVFRGSEGRYWSSTAGSHLEVSNTGVATGNSTRRYGYSVRCMSETLAGQIGALACASAFVSDDVEPDQPANGVTVTVPYTGGNGGAYQGQSLSSTGVSGLTATLPAGNFAVGSGALTLTLSGIAQQGGTAEFTLTVGGQSCVVEVQVNAGYPVGYVHCDPANPTVVNDVTNPTTGKVWMDRNLGASRVATSYNDAQAYGDLYQWGRFADGHQCRNSETTSTNATTAVPNAGNVWDGKFIVETSLPGDWLVPQNTNLWQGLNGVNNPCPNGYRLPNEAEWEAERQSWGSNNSDGAFESPLRLPLAGYRNGSSGVLSNTGSGSICSYWSSSVSGSNAHYLRLSGSSAYVGSDGRSHGGSVRCYKD